MRIISFSKRWDKLSLPVFTTFRFPRKDRDWTVGEHVQVFLRSRSPNRERLGVAVIIDKELRPMGPENDAEAQSDGFKDMRDMERWIIKTYGHAGAWLPMNKLTLRWDNSKLPDR